MKENLKPIYTLALSCPGHCAVLGSSDHRIGIAFASVRLALLAYPFPLERFFLVDANGADALFAAGSIPSGARYGAGSGNQVQADRSGWNRTAAMCFM